MPQYSFDISKIITEVFGGSYVGKDFPNASSADTSTEASTPTDGLNHNGTNGVFYYTPTSLNGVQLPNEPLIAINGGKKVVSTALAGNTKRGKVKEIINTEDYTITLRGVIINEDSEDYPWDEVEALKDICEMNEAISIVNAITNIFEIENVVITNYSFPEMVGRPNMQAYSITMLSDEDFVLIQD